jgi:putative ABC transport system permease protein
MLGARPLHLLRESLAESALVAIGTALAMPVAGAALNLSSRFLTLPTDLRISIDARLDARAIAVAMACALATALICAPAPWFMTMTTAPYPSSARVTGSTKVRHTLVVMQVSVAAALVGVGFLLLAGIAATRGIALGYRTDHILLLSFDPSQVRTDETHGRAFYGELLRRTNQLPGVRGTALAQSVPLGFTGVQERVKIEAAGPAAFDYWMNTVTPGYFELMRMPLAAGRDFSLRDVADSPPVVIVNQTLARLWPGGKALGHTIEIRGRPVEIIGVVKTAKYLKVGEAPRSFFYLPYAQRYAPRMTLHVQTQGPPGNNAPAVLAVARELDPTQPVGEVRSLEEYFERGALFLARTGVSITAAAGGCALLLALIGLYSCMARAVSRRRRELGIRRALGATRLDIMRLVLSQGLRLAASGVVIGLGIALAIGHSAGSTIAPGGAPSLRTLVVSQVLAGTFVAAASLAACLIPAWRAAGVDPSIALRR